MVLFLPSTSSYVSKFNKSNIILYSFGQLDVAPSEYKRIEIKKTARRLDGIFGIRNILNWLFSCY